MNTIIKQSTEQMLKSAREEIIKKLIKDISEKMFQKILKETGQKISKEALEKMAKEAVEKTLKEGSENMTEEILTKTVKEAATEAVEKGGKDLAKEASEKAAKEAAENAAKSKNSISKMGKGILSVAAVVTTGIVTYDIYDKSSKSFEKRNGKTFKIIEISNNNENNVKLVLENPENIKFYKEEEVEITNTDIQFNGRYEIKSVDNNTIILNYNKKLDIKGTRGDIKLFANMKNDLNNTIDEGLKEITKNIGDVTGVNNVINTIKTIGYIIFKYGFMVFIAYLLYQLVPTFNNKYMLLFKYLFMIIVIMLIYVSV